MSVKILNATQKAEVVRSFDNGVSKAALARHFKVSSDTITRVIAEASPAIKVPVEDITPTRVEFKGVSFIQGDLVARQIIVDPERADLGTVYVRGDVMDLYDVDYDGTELTAEDCVEKDVFYDVPVYVRELFVVSPWHAEDDVEGEFTQITASKFIEAELKKETPKKTEAPVIEAKEEKIIWNANSKFISITVGRQTYNADRDHANFQLALQALVEDRVQDALDYINTERKILKFAKGNVRIENGMVYYKDLQIDSGLTRRIIDAANTGDNIDSLIVFFEALMENPSRTAVYRLYDFLQANDIEITDRGTFLAWKKVRSNYKDIHSGTFDNSPGKTCEMPRNMVDEDDERTCSAGLHVCSKAYLPHFGASSGNRIVQVEVHPRDVVSIPVDYGNAKMRTAKYIVLKDVTDIF